MANQSSLSHPHRHQRKIVADFKTSRRRTVFCSTVFMMLSLMVSCRSSSIAAFTGPVRHRQANRSILSCREAGVRSKFHHAVSPLSATTNAASNIRTTSTALDKRSDIVRGNSKLSLAPMMEYTDRHFRHMVRLLSGKTLLYTEMVAANAIAHERDNAFSNEGSTDDKIINPSSLVDSAEFDPSYLLRFLGQGHNPEGPSVLQLGGSEPDQLFLAAKTVYEFNQMHQSTQKNSEQSPIFCDYSAINLNCGCPSPKVAGKGCFGAALMQDPQLVKRLTTSLHEGAEGTMPITVKCRIGTDEGYTFTAKDYLSRSEDEEYQNLKRFVETVASDGIVTDFQIHARIAVLGKNYSPTDNRKVPPLRYDHVRRLAQEFPELNISLNGGIETLSGVKRELDDCGDLQGVMVGRGFVANPWAFAMADEVLYKSEDASASSRRPKNRMEVLEAYGRHADYEEERWDSIKIRRFMTRAISHLFAGEPNAKRYRIALDDIAGLPKKFDKERKQNPNVVHSEQPPLSELIMNIATTHLSEEVLYRTPEESYAKLLWEEEKTERRLFDLSNSNGESKGNSDDDEIDTKKSLVQEWQTTRKEDEMYEKEESKMSVSES